jgi:hypothetical protein
LKHILSLEPFKSARIVFTPESNLAFIGAELTEVIKSDAYLKDKVIIMRECKGDRPGIWVDNSMKKELAAAYGRKIEKRKIKQYKHFFTLTESPTAKITAQDLWDEIFHQNECYSKILKPSNDIHAQPKEFYGGKMGHGFDDLVIAQQINNLSKKRFYTSEKYKKYFK